MVKYIKPTPEFPYKITKRLNIISEPKEAYEDDEYRPEVTPYGVRKSALNGSSVERVKDLQWPDPRRMLMTKKMYKHRFSDGRLERMDKMIARANATPYVKLGKRSVDINEKESKKARWTQNDWNKRMGRINVLATPKPDYTPPPVERGEKIPLDDLMPRIEELAEPPEHRIHRRLSQESGYRDPIKVRRAALKYVISDRVKQLATPKIYQPT
ncbi:uncharacterized protein LOC105395639 [Plutella xylostella]|uniref:uncharacterized protein LOC105395639 n=1 Tax=Plutella xylostella TaxID=51655 RepID=UPI0020330339|nr:uncharacterized protein LOC105395639 [Plutella xylostella]